MQPPKRIVYVLKSEGEPKRYYTGLTSDIVARLDAHNAGRCPHTASGKPWIIDVIVEFSDERRAVAFEKYLKSGCRIASSARQTFPRPHRRAFAAARKARFFWLGFAIDDVVHTRR